MKHLKSALARPSMVEDPKLELKALPPHLRYVFLGRNDTLSVLNALHFTLQQVKC